MSFSSGVKAELCRAALNRPCCTLSEAYGVLLFSNIFSQREIRIVTASREFCRRLPKLFERVFGFGFDRSGDAGSGKTAFLIEDGGKIASVFARCELDMGSNLAHHINLAVLDGECCRAAFVRGAFLAGGSVTDPEKNYHLEFSCDHRHVAGELSSLLLEMGFEPRSVERAGHSIVYFKQSEAIADLLTTIGAPASAMEIMSAKVEKEMRNRINRRVNCDSANADKIVSAAQSQLEMLRRLDRTVGITSLPEPLQETALLRIANPELSLSDLAALSNPPVSKSCISHRLRKLMSLAGE